jgi:GNAT superfamily N-acetyltransferase
MPHIASLILRKATAEDAACIARVQIASWRAAYKGIVDDEFLAAMNAESRAQQWSRACERTTCTLLVAVLDGDVVGFCYHGVSQYNDEPSHYAELWAIYVHPNIWGRGVGKGMLERAFSMLRESGYGMVFLWVLRDNARSRSFYEAAGMTLADGGRTWKSARQELALVRYEKVL